MSEITVVSTSGFRIGDYIVHDERLQRLEIWWARLFLWKWAVPKTRRVTSRITAVSNATFSVYEPVYSEILLGNPAASVHSEDEEA